MLPSAFRTTAKFSPASIFGAVTLSLDFGITFTSMLYVFPVSFDVAFTLVTPTLCPVIIPVSLTVAIVSLNDLYSTYSPPFFNRLKYSISAFTSFCSPTSIFIFPNFPTNWYNPAITGVTLLLFS